MIVEDVYRSRDLLARFVGPGTGSDCVVTFDSLGVVSSLDRPGFGEGFLRSRGLDAVHILSREGRWYQEADLSLLLKRVRERVGGYRRVLSYGSSMGGYGAIHFGGEAGAHAALALSPQFSNDPLRVPFERRWRVESRTRVAWREGNPLSLGRVYIAYDPFDPDRHHVELFARLMPITSIELPYAGHPAGAYLSEIGLLSELFETALGGTFDPMFERRARVLRRRSGQYFFTLARRAPLRRLALKTELARLAVGASPGEPAYRAYLALLRDYDGDHAGASDVYRAMVRDPANAPPILLGRHGRFLLRQGRAAEALIVARQAARLAPAQPSLQKLLALAELAAGRPREAARPAWSFATGSLHRAGSLAVALAVLSASRLAGPGFIGRRLRRWIARQHAAEIAVEIRKADS